MAGSAGRLTAGKDVAAGGKSDEGYGYWGKINTKNNQRATQTESTRTRESV
jgi:hypothetical protein